MVAWGRLATVGWLIVAAVVGALATAAAASAHASVVTSSPADGTHLEGSPDVLTFDLTEPVTLVEESAQLIDIDGARYPFASANLEGGRQRIVLQLAQSVPDGSYLATARVVSADTHVVSLSIRFAVGEAQPGQWAEGDDDAAAVNPYVVYPVKIAVYLGLVLSAGLLLASRWVGSETTDTPRLTSVYRFGAALLALGLLGRLAILATEQAGSLRAISASGWWTVVTTPFGVVTVIAVAVSCLLAARESPRVGLVHAGVAIVAVSLGGHGGSTELWPLPLISTVIHVYAVAVWLGGIAAIALVWRPIPNLDTWHRVAVWHVILVITAGGVLAVLQVRPAAALLTTSYGLILLTKVTLVAGAVVTAYFVWRHYRQEPDTPSESVVVQTRTRRVVAEATLVVLVVVVTSSLSTLTPAKDSYTASVATQLDFGTEVLGVRIDTVRRGAQVLTVEYPGQLGDAAVDVEYSSAQANVARLPVELTPTPGDGDVVWTSEGLIVPSPGQWKVTVRFDDGAGSPKLASFSYQVL